MIEPDVTMNSEDSAFMGKLKKLRDGLDDFNCRLASIDGSTMRLGLLCEETAAACSPGAVAMAQALVNAGLGASYSVMRSTVRASFDFGRLVHGNEFDLDFVVQATANGIVLASGTSATVQQLAATMWEALGEKVVSA
jgi:hypothetical protein